jgi:hypothetical protein
MVNVGTTGREVNVAGKAMKEPEICHLLNLITRNYLENLDESKI